MKCLLVIIGPTASGKTDLAIELAQWGRGSEILSADARQFYRELRIGTAMPSAAQLAQVKHYFIGHLSIHDRYNAGLYEKDALQQLNEIFKANDTAILVGGSGLYIQAVCEGLDAYPPIPEEIRQQLRQAYREAGIIYLQQQLQQADPQYYACVDRNNPHRLIRALEVCIATGKPFSSFHRKRNGNGPNKKRSFRIIKIGLLPERKVLYARIDSRVEDMLRAGLEEEARTLYPHRHLTPLQTVGYRELFDYFEGKYTLQEAIALIKQHTRNYAKRQLTWFRKDKEIKWFAPDDKKSLLEYLAVQLPHLATPIH